jgi:hypothetical protein
MVTMIFSTTAFHSSAPATTSAAIRRVEAYLRAHRIEGQARPLAQAIVAEASATCPPGTPLVSAAMEIGMKRMTSWELHGSKKGKMVAAPALRLTHMAQREPESRRRIPARLSRRQKIFSGVSTGFMAFTGLFRTSRSASR